MKTAKPVNPNKKGRIGVTQQRAVTIDPHRPVLNQRSVFRRMISLLTAEESTYEISCNLVPAGLCVPPLTR